MQHNMVSWFEIPVTDMDRAKAFYDTVFGIEISVHNMNELIMGWFPSFEGQPGAAGSLVLNKDFYFPGENKGVVIYFSSEDVQIQLNRIEAAGGKIVQPKTEIGAGHGFMAVFMDTEGNRIALHSQK